MFICETFVSSVGHHYRTSLHICIYQKCNIVHHYYDDNDTMIIDLFWFTSSSSPPTRDHQYNITNKELGTNKDMMFGPQRERCLNTRVHLLIENQCCQTSTYIADMRLTGGK